MSVSDFINQLCTVMLPNDQTITGILRTDGTNFGFDNGFGFPEAAIEEVRKIEAGPEINMVRVVLVLKKG